MASKHSRSMEVPEFVPVHFAATSSCFSPKKFFNPVSFKLDEDNSLAWRHQAYATIKAHKLYNHLGKEKVPKRFLTQEDEEDENESQEFIDWEQQDQHLVSWLLASMSPFTNKVVGCDFAHQIWARYQASVIKALSREQRE